MRISYEAIDQALYIQGRGALKRDLVACLRTGQAPCVPRARSRNRAVGHVTTDVVISQRPAVAVGWCVGYVWDRAGWTGGAHAPAGRGCTGPGHGPVGVAVWGSVGAADRTGMTGVEAAASAPCTPTPRPQPPTLLLVGTGRMKPSEPNGVSKASDHKQ